MLSKLVTQLHAKLLLELMPSMCPGLFDAFKNPNADVRKAVVFCLVDIYMVLGDDFAPFLGDLNTSQVVSLIFSPCFGHQYTFIYFSLLSPLLS